MLLLADLEGKSNDELREHIVSEYDVERELVDEFNFIIAYESVGDYGCDSSSWFLMYRKDNGELFENHGSHCSCYGFEGQFEPERTDIPSLMHRWSLFHCGGYDDHGDDNRKKAREYLEDLHSIIRG